MSKENRPVGSVAEASMSPAESLTTNVLPSRILISSLIASPSRAEARERARWNRIKGSSSPSMPILPRSTSAIAFARPVASRSNSGRSTRTVESADAFRRDTVTSPRSMVTSQRALLLPSTMSKRIVPLTFASSGSWPRRSSSAKNSVGRIGHALSPPRRNPMRETSSATTVTRYSCPASASMMASMCPKLCAGACSRRTRRSSA